MLGALVLLFTALKLLPNVAWPLLIAAVGAYLVDPLVVVLERKGLSRTAATGVLFSVSLVTGGLALYLFLPVLLRQIEKLPGYFVSSVENALPELQTRLSSRFPGIAATLDDWLGGGIETLASKALPQAGGMVGTVVGGSLSLLAGVMGALVVAVVGFSLVSAWPRMREKARDLVPPKLRERFLSRMGAIDRMLGGFVRGQLIVVVFLATTYSILLSLLGLKLAVVAGIVTGVSNLVPYLGTIFGMLLASVFCLVDFGLDHRVVLVILTFIAVSNTDALFVTPRVVGNRVGLPPAAVIVAILALGSLLGFAGVLLAVPTAATLLMVARVLLGVYRRSRFYA